MCSGMASMAVSSSFSTMRTFSWSASVMRLMAKPICPQRPLRPIRCKYVGASSGKSKLITTFTLGTSMPLDTRLELMSVLNSPFRNLQKILSRSSLVLEVRYSFSKPLLFIFFDRNSALLLDLQKMMHWFTISSLQILYKYCSFSDSSTRMQQCVSPSNMSSSIRLMTSASGMNFCLKLLILTGKVAEYRYSPHFLGRNWIMSEMSYSVLSLSRLSASSSTKKAQSASRFFFLLRRSLSLPAVQMARWMPSSSILAWSSLTARPPMRDSILTPLNLANLLAISWTWKASSRVLAITTAWMEFFLTSISLRMGIRQAAVLPVPFLARAMMDLRWRMRGMDSSWMGVGLLKPAWARASRMFSSRPSSANE